MNIIKEWIAECIRTVLKYVIKQKIDNILEDKPKQEQPDLNIHTKEDIDVMIDASDTAIPSDILNQFSFKDIAEPSIINPDGSKTLLIVDDVVYTKLLYQFDFNNIKKQYNKDVAVDYKIVNCLDPTAGYSAYKYAIIDNNKIDVAIIDITLGYRVSINDKYYTEIDGIDLAYHLVNKYPDIKYVLCTAHTLNVNNQIVKKYNDKMLKCLGCNIEDKYINKNEYRVDKLYKLLYEGKDDVSK